MLYLQYDGRAAGHSRTHKHVAMKVYEPLIHLHLVNIRGHSIRDRVDLFIYYLVVNPGVGKS